MFDTLVVGAGTTGCVVAARLAERPGHRVLLLEAGPARLDPDLRRVSSLAVAGDPGHPWNWAYRADLGYGASHTVPRGRGLGGSSAINGAVFVRATPADADGWGPGWSWEELLPYYVRCETDLDHTGPLHGDRGPIPVQRPAGPLLHPAAERFLGAAERLGFPAEPDKNAGTAPGVGLVPCNAVDGRRVDAATAYGIGRDRPGLTVWTGAQVARVLLDGDRAVGVELLDGTRVEAGEVVLAAGAVGSPHLLMLSGVGPADVLRNADVPVRHDLPGVGQGFSDHPCVYLPFVSPGDPPAHPDAPTVQVALDLDLGGDPAGEVELLLFVRPFTPDTTGHVACGLQRPDSRGVITLTSPDPRRPPRLEYRYLRTEHDRRRLRHAVRTAAELLRAGVGGRVTPSGDVLGSDEALDAWVVANLTTAIHMCGSCAIGEVVDEELRVRGIAGLRVADTSVLPVAPRRGTAATAVAIGEKAADLLRR